MPTDVVVVSYNSRGHIRGCVEPLSRLPGVHVVVVDNASDDESLAAVSDLPVSTIERPENGGFAVGCNAGWRAGTGRFVVFLNPDATIDENSLRRLTGVLAADSAVGAVAPRIERPDGSRALSLRRFPRARSTFAQALFLHRLFPRSAWCDEHVKRAVDYTRPWSPEWVSGACIALRRSVLEELGGWDEGFFLYGEDVDLCFRLRRAGYDVRYEPSARVVHDEGASSSRAASLPRLAAARIRFARKHYSGRGAVLERAGVALWALTRIVVSRGGRKDRAGHARALGVALRGAEITPPGGRS